MRALIKLLFSLLLIATVAVLILGWFAFSDEPGISDPVTLSHQDIARAKAILKQNDPRGFATGAQRAVEINQADLNLASNYLLGRIAQGGAKIRLSQDALLADATILVDRVPLRPYLNVKTQLVSDSGTPRIAVLQVGDVEIPAELAQRLVPQLVNLLLSEDQQQVFINMMGPLQIFPDRVRLTYRWNPAAIDQARDTLLTPTDREALRYYHDRIVELQSQGIGRNGSLLTVLQPLFADARRRSDDGGDPIAENKALLTVMGTWGSRRNLAQLVPNRPQRPGYFRLKLEGRTDFGQHFVASAALAARGDRSLSDAVGLFKEITDTDHGSGFSFTDIAADRAGTRFGEIATRSEASARFVQKRLTQGVAETDIMPPAKDLPENLRGQAFKNQFGGVGSSRYRKMIAEIDGRIDACSLYRE